ncbi:hypothetical protein BGZ60DRAFT_532953 [Tricladium varicosporioides]|nr:hypothetical protein BGZ60DRAFT_532953 [Hymenoscyphus varicosporioides]
MTCYYPDGSEAIKTSLGPTMLACDPLAKQSSCCAYGDNCMANGLCLSAQLFFYRGGCTDRSWKDSACLQECKNSTQMPSGSPSLSNFQIISWCQNPYIKSAGVPDGSALFVCSGATSDCGKKNFTLSAYSVAVTSVTGIISTSSSASLSSTSTPNPSSTLSNPTAAATSPSSSTSSPAAAAAATSTTTTGITPTTLGIGIATPLTILLLVAFIFLFLERKKRTRAEKSLQETNIPPYTKAENKSPSAFTTEAPSWYQAASQMGPVEVGHGGHDRVAEMPTGVETRRELWDESGYQGAGLGMDEDMDGGRSAVHSKYIGMPLAAERRDGRHGPNGLVSSRGQVP